MAEVYSEQITGLMQEKFKVVEEERKIKENRNLTFVDKHVAIKQARSLSRTIDGLLDTQKERLSEYCQES